MIHIFLMGQELYSLTVISINSTRTGDMLMRSTRNVFTGEERKIITEIKD